MIPSFEISPDTRALADKLAQVPHGGSVTYGELSEVIGRNVLRCRHLVYSALKLCRKESGAVFGTDRGLGYVRVPVEKLPDLGHGARRHIRRSARAAYTKMADGMAKANDVPNKTRLKINSEITALGVIQELARDKHTVSTKEMENKPLPVAKAAREFLKSLGAADLDD